MEEIRTRAMTEHQAFLCAISEAPEENGPRLVYADWLEEQGDPLLAARAELIRVQLELARPSPWNKSKRRRAALQIRERQLLAEPPGEWLGPWQAVPFRWVFWRGMPERFAAVAHGRLLDNDRLQQRVEFGVDGRVRVPAWDWAWEWSEYGGHRFTGSLQGHYRLGFTFAEIRIELDLWSEMDAEVRFAGRLVRTGEGVVLELEEERRDRRRGERRTLALSAVE
jgi:uncharacterized protein (TIGR02996 family)